MKTKAKLLLAISTLSAVVLAAGVTSTFAWFTTQAKATLSTGTMTVTTVSDIKINATKLAYDLSTATSGRGFGVAGQAAADEDVELGPVSSTDGLHFYAPKALRTGEAGDVYKNTDMAEVTTKTAWEPAKSNSHVGYVKYKVNVLAKADTGTPRTLKFHLAPTVTDAELMASYRVSIYKELETETPGEYTYDKIGIYSNGGGNKAGWDTTKAAVDEALQTVNYSTLDIATVDKDHPVTLKDEATTPAPITTAADIDRNYIFAVWVEGCDTNATNLKISAATLAVDLVFSLE